MIPGLTLALDASTYTGSVALLDADRVLAERSPAMRGERVERLMPALAEVLAEARVSSSDLDRIVCGSGPGSFTSLRIASSIAKGIATGAGKPLLAVSSLLLVVAGMVPAPEAGRYLAVLDAMRGELFAAVVLVTDHGLVRSMEAPRLLSAAGAAAEAARLSATLVGPGHEVHAVPHARGVARVEEESLVVVDLDTWEPNYGRLAEAQVKWETAHGRPLPRG
jgi:tRNA threonylcarbamoyladenosine biosynthesis protein TsaB